MRVFKSTKKGIAFLSVVLILIFNAIPVFAADEVQDYNVKDTRIVDTSPRVNMTKIVVSPTYSDSNGNTIVYGKKEYTYYRSGNNRQGIFCTVTPEQIESMKESIINERYVQNGYEINVFYKMTGNFRSGVVVTREPANMPIKSVGPDITYYTTFYTDIDNPALSWNAYFGYLYNNNSGTQLMQAGVYF